MSALVEGVKLLCLDAGNTIIFFDHERLGALSGIEPSVLVRTEGEAKRLAEEGGLHDCAWGSKALPGATSWGRIIGTMVLRGGVAEASVPALLDAAWAEHVKRNLWCKIPDGLGAALDELRDAGVPVAVISNSEGKLEPFLVELGIRQHFDLIVDSGLTGFEKPDPRIFHVAFDRFGVQPADALHLGDVYATDVLGARAAGCRVALVDPFDHFGGHHRDVPRVEGAAAIARAISASRR